MAGRLQLSPGWWLMLLSLCRMLYDYVERKRKENSGAQLHVTYLLAGNLLQNGHVVSVSLPAGVCGGFTSVGVFSALFCVLGSEAELALCSAGLLERAQCLSQRAGKISWFGNTVLSDTPGF